MDGGGGEAIGILIARRSSSSSTCATTTTTTSRYHFNDTNGERHWALSFADLSEKTGNLAECCVLTAGNFGHDNFKPFFLSPILARTFAITIHYRKRGKRNGSNVSRDLFLWLWLREREILAIRRRFVADFRINRGDI